MPQVLLYQQSMHSHGYLLMYYDKPNFVDTLTVWHQKMTLVDTQCDVPLTYGT